jgi:hypothetical protein
VNLLRRSYKNGWVDMSLVIILDLHRNICRPTLDKVYKSCKYLFDACIYSHFRFIVVYTEGHFTLESNTKEMLIYG